MPKIGIVTGDLLIVLGIVAYFLGDRASWTALIPSIVGALILLGSVIALKERWLKHGMHVAALFGLLGFLAPLGRIIPQLAKGSFELNLAMGSMLLMLLICGVFVALCVRSFRLARRMKQAAAAK